METSRAIASILLGRSPLLAILPYLGLTFLDLSPLILFIGGMGFGRCISLAYFGSLASSLIGEPNLLD